MKKLILEPFYGYIFFKKYPKLANDTARATVHQGNDSVLDKIDKDLDTGFLLASKIGRPIDYWATHIAIGGYAVWRLLAEDLDENDPIRIFNEIRRFYKEGTVATFKTPFSFEEWKNIRQPLEKKFGEPGDNFNIRNYFETGVRSEEPLVGEALCLSDVIFSRLLSSHGYAYVPSHPLSILSSYGRMFSQVEETIRKDVKLSKAFESYSAEKSLHYLIGERAGGMNELLGFMPINPLELVTPEATNEQIDEVVLKIRKGCTKIRKLIEEVHVRCLNKQIEKAIDSKKELEDIRANQLINYTILDSTSELMNKNLEETIHVFIDDMLKNEMKSNVIWLHKTAKKLKDRVGWISEAKFLTFGAILMLTSCGADSSYLNQVFEVLGKTSLAMGGCGVLLKTMEEGMKIYPGFSIYSSFINWPTIA